MLYRSAMFHGVRVGGTDAPGGVLSLASGAPPRRVASTTRRAPRRGGRRRAAAARRRRLGRARPVIILAAIAFLAGAIVGAQRSDGHRALALRFISDWSAQRYGAMYADVDAATRNALSPASFSDAYASAWNTATTASLRVAGHVHETSSGAIVAPMAVHTRLFGVLHADLTVPFVHDASGTHVAWSRALTFPGLRPGEVLHSRLALPPRAALLARDGSVLASGPAVAGGERYSPLGPAVTGIVGTTGPIPASQLASLEAAGVPPDADVGQSGLELIFDAQLRGRAGGVLLAGHRVVATAAAIPGTPTRTTISPALQTAAVVALGGQLGGVVALRPSTGEILAVAGLGVDDLQPPGSTFKMVTTSGALQYGIATPSTVFPYATEALLDGVPLTNAGMEDCGGTLTLAFTVSCNSVFAPLGAKLGAQRLVATAERFGFNEPVGIPGVVESTLPPASQIQGDLAVGSTAIGQDMVLASPLEMAIVAATIGEGGMRPRPTFMRGRPSGRIRATTAKVAHEVRRMMIDVVQSGTGTAAALPNVTVAGKTGTAELVNTNAPGASTPQNTDAWFAAFAPALGPHVAVGVMLVRDGAGGATAAPVARAVLESALSNGF